MTHVFHDPELSELARLADELGATMDTAQPAAGNFLADNAWDQVNGYDYFTAAGLQQGPNGAPPAGSVGGPQGTPGLGSTVPIAAQPVPTTPPSAATPANPSPADPTSLTTGNILANDLQQQNDADVSSLDRITNPQGNPQGYTGTQTDAQQAAQGAQPTEIAGTALPAAETYVTVPVDKVVVSQSGAAKVTPLYASGTGYKKDGTASIPPTSVVRGGRA